MGKCGVSNFSRNLEVKKLEESDSEVWKLEVLETPGLSVGKPESEGRTAWVPSVHLASR